MPDRRRFLLSEFIAGLAHAMDLVSPILLNHHKRVGYMAYALASEVGLPDQMQSVIATAGLLHDSGALSLNDRLGALRFELDMEVDGSIEHAYMGYVLLRPFDIFADVAPIVRHHHLWWERAGECTTRKDLVFAANIIHLVDRVDVLIDSRREILDQTSAIIERIKAQSGRMFARELVDAFCSVSRRECFWLDLFSSDLRSLIQESLGGWHHKLTDSELLELSKLFSTVIDFRSRFTATHSAGVSATAEALAGLCGFSPGERDHMRLAGYLHDLGKLAVPAEILEKPGRLTSAEFAVVRSHTYHTYKVLQGINGLGIVNEWASFHHERLNGDGYPFKRAQDNLSLGSRIMAVADVLTAITEDRPYRAGMTQEQAMAVLRGMGSGGALDPNLVELLGEKFDDVNHTRNIAQNNALREFEHQTERTSDPQ